MRKTTWAGRPATRVCCQNWHESVHQITGKPGLYLSSGTNNCCFLVLFLAGSWLHEDRGLSITVDECPCMSKVVHSLISDCLQLLFDVIWHIQQKSWKLVLVGCFACFVVCWVVGFLFFFFLFWSKWHTIQLLLLKEIILFPFFLPSLCLPQIDLNNSKAPI